MRGYEEARQGQRAARYAGEEDVGGVEGGNLWEDLLDQVVDSLGVGDAVVTLEAGRPASALAPK